ncbi:MAG: endolytic transglycosylase MltG, partial [Culicoidibacterales bacterium]
MMKNNHRKSPKIIIWSIIASVFAILLMTITVAYFLFGPINLFQAQQKRYIVAETTTLTAIADELEDMGIIRNAQALTWWSKITGRNEIPEGIYVFSTQMLTFEIGDILTDGRDSNERVLTIVEGDTIPQVASKIAAVLEQPTANVLTQMDNREWIETLQADYWFLSEAIFAEGIKHPLEGYLAADTYFVQSDSSVESIVIRLLDQMDVILAPYEASIAEFELNIAEVLTLASIVEREASERVDRELVAGVFLNRLAIDMPLGSDVTVAYAVDKVALNFTMAELQTDSPYNTYVITGLPVGPVGNPSADAIEAVLNYQASENLYFLADVCTD